MQPQGPKVRHMNQSTFDPLTWPRVRCYIRTGCKNAGVSLAMSRLGSDVVSEITKPNQSASVSQTSHLCWTISLRKYYTCKCYKTQAPDPTVFSKQRNQSIYLCIVPKKIVFWISCYRQWREKRVISIHLHAIIFSVVVMGSPAKRSVLAHRLLLVLCMNWIGLRNRNASNFLL